jgi:hypothetical protein
MKKAFFIIQLLLFIPLFIFCQEGRLTPFPTELSVKAVDTEIILNWKDTNSLNGEIYHIHRLNRPITVDNISEADLVGTVAEGTQTYRETPPGGIYWYYLVTVEDNRFHYPIIIPYGNASSSGVKLNLKELALSQAVKISNLTARSVRENVIITFNRNRNDRIVSLYRSTSPITNTNQLGEALLLTILEKDQQSWRDTPIPGIPYYYAAIDRELLIYGEDAEILYEGNHTQTATKLSLSEFFDNPAMTYPIRKAPLPTLQLENYYTDLPQLQLTFPEYQELNVQLKNKLSVFLTTPTEMDRETLAPLILNEDRLDSSNALEERLKKILGEYFLKARYKQAERSLLIMLSESEEEVLTSRIHFYRGQCCYFIEDYETAYLEFLLSRDVYYQESQRWMDGCLNELN